jgi:hypothetical protein
MNKIKLYDYIAVFSDKSSSSEIRAEAFDRVENKKAILDWEGDVEITAVKLGPTQVENMVLYSVTIYGV